MALKLKALYLLFDRHLLFDGPNRLSLGLQTAILANARMDWRRSGLAPLFYFWKEADRHHRQVTQCSSFRKIFKTPPLREKWRRPNG
jgi:hypothetical protein